MNDGKIKLTNLLHKRALANRVATYRLDDITEAKAALVATPEWLEHERLKSVDIQAKKTAGDLDAEIRELALELAEELQTTKPVDGVTVTKSTVFNVLDPIAALNYCISGLHSALSLDKRALKKHALDMDPDRRPDCLEVEVLTYGKVQIATDLSSYLGTKPIDDPDNPILDRSDFLGTVKSRSLDPDADLVIASGEITTEGSFHTIDTDEGPTPAPPFTGTPDDEVPF